MKAMKKWISTALGLMLAGVSAPALAQNTSANQATADAVAGALSDNAGLSASRIKIEFRNGQVTLSGVVPAPELKTEALRRASQVAGVSQVVDRLTVGDPRIVPARYPVEADPARVAMGGGPFNQTLENVGTVIGGPAGAMGNGQPIMLDSNSAGMMGGMGGMDGMMGMGGPMPESPAAMPGATQAANPGYPNYAWPSYAPYPNFSAVG
ncbi:MAG TPA: BON domain-containing protein, partial [Isosphaeraceae bacterium]|nr:BON domain-containing protein [Isosphaeraceae bacterium]